MTLDQYCDFPFGFEQHSWKKKLKGYFQESTLLENTRENTIRKHKRNGHFNSKFAAKIDFLFFMQKDK